MRFLTTTILAIAAALMVIGSGLSRQIGPEIRIGGGEATVGGVGVKKGGKLAVPSVDQVLDTVINTNPATALLSDADKENVKQAIKTAGFVAAVANDPITGIIIISVLSGKGEQKDLPVPQVDAPPTGKTWNLAAACIVQQEGGIITAMFNDDPQPLSQLKPGDALKFTAPYCKEYKNKSITAVTVKYTGKTDQPDAQPPLYRHYVTGRTA